MVAAYDTPAVGAPLFGRECFEPSRPILYCRRRSIPSERFEDVAAEVIQKTNSLPNDHKNLAIN